MSLYRGTPRPAHPHVLLVRWLRTTRHASSETRVESSASAKLWADAEAEEGAAAARARRAAHLLSKDENWTGDERVEDTVLRMLVDKYKPLRSGTIQSAEDKIRQRKDVVLPLHPTTALTPSAPPPLTAPAEHKPWLVTFRAPSHASSPSIKFGHIKPSKSPSLPAAALNDPRVRAAAKLSKKRTELAGRITQARESTLDYRLGSRSAATPRPASPTSLRGWTSLIEDRIERARAAGLFDNVPGRGKPMVRDLEERNPFLPREEFFMNRIVKRNGAAPPWIELQREMEDALDGFRLILRQSWIRRATRMLALSRSRHDLAKLTAHDATRLRDAEWEARESAYHSKAVDELNGLIRKYNGLAPYAVRRPYITRAAELERCFESSGDDIVAGLSAARSTAQAAPLPVSTSNEENDPINHPSSITPQEHAEIASAHRFGLWNILSRWVERLFNRSQS